MWLDHQAEALTARFQPRHLARIREMLQHLDAAIARDEERGAEPHRKYGSRSALKGIIEAAEWMVAEGSDSGAAFKPDAESFRACWELKEKYRVELSEALAALSTVRAELEEARDLLETSEALKVFHENNEVRLARALQWAVDNSHKAQGERGAGLPMMRAALEAVK